MRKGIVGFESLENIYRQAGRCYLRRRERRCRREWMEESQGAEALGSTQDVEDSAL